MAKINSIEFNQDYSCVAVATSEYNRIFNCEPFGEFYSSGELSKPRRSISGSNTGGLGNSEDTSAVVGEASDVIGQPTKFLRMLFSTPLTIIVPQYLSGGGNVRDRLLHIYNLKLLLKICELTFPTAIVDVKVNRKRLLVMLESGQIYVYDLSCVRLLGVIDITPQKNYVFDLSVDEDSMLVIPLSVVSGGTNLVLLRGSGFAANENDTSEPFENIVDFSKEKPSKPSKLLLETILKDPEGWLLVYDCIGLKPLLVYKAHDSAIASLAVSHDGSMIASASVKGTIIRVSSLYYDKSIDSITINKITNLRRGHNPTSINALSFSLDNSILGCGSVNSTVHLFKLDEPNGDDSDFISSNDHDQEIHPDAEGDFEVNDGDRLSDNETSSNRSTEDLNESLANLLISKSNDEDDANTQPYGETSGNSGGTHNGQRKHLKSYFKLLNNHYARLLIKKLPYKNYLDNLIWTPPRRSFAFIKVPENATHGQLKIGFSQDLVLVAAYNSGQLLKYRLPYNHDSERQQCQLVSTYELV